MRAMAYSCGAGFLATTLLLGCFEGSVILAEGGGGSAGATTTTTTGGPGCVVDEDCPESPDCQSRRCDVGSCVTDNIPAATILTEQTQGDCMRRECDGAGAVVEVVMAKDSPDASACAKYSCSRSGEVVTEGEPLGTPCGVGLTCDGFGLCVGCVSPTDCPTTACNNPTCVNRQCGQSPAPAGQLVPGDPSNNCRNTVCDGGGAVSVVNDNTDLPATDSNPCTLEACNAGVPSTTPKAVGAVVAAENGVLCNGVCQAGDYLGTCGLRLYSRPFPAAGAWTSMALSASLDWSGSNAPAPTRISAAEETSTGNRLMVVRQDGATSSYHQRLNGVWAPAASLASVGATSVIAANTQISSIYSGDFGPSGEIVVFGTAAPAPQAYTWYLNNNSIAGPTPIAMGTDNTNPSWIPPQHLFTIEWTFGEQRGSFASNPPPISWKFCDNLVYAESANDFTGYGPPATEPASQLQITGSNGAPSPGTVLAAYHRNATDTLYVIAP